MAAALIIGDAQKIELARLRARATSEPIDVRGVMKLTETREGLVEHLARMETYTIPLPTSFIVTFTVETGHPAGTCRHMSMSSMRPNRMPTPEAVWIIAEVLGFVGGLDRCAVWEEDIGRGKAINIVQPIRHPTAIPTHT